MTKANVIFYFAFIFALWFLLSCWAWTYAMNVVISFPFAIGAFFMARAGKKIEGPTKRFKIVEGLLLIGCAIALISLVGFMIFN